MACHHARASSAALLLHVPAPKRAGHQQPDWTDDLSEPERPVSGKHEASHLLTKRLANRLRSPDGFDTSEQGFGSPARSCGITPPGALPISRSISPVPQQRGCHRSPQNTGSVDQNDSSILSFRQLMGAERRKRAVRARKSAACHRGPRRYSTRAGKLQLCPLYLTAP